MNDTAPRYPRQVKYIVFSEACERFSFYGMSTILVPYMERALGWSEADSSATYHYFVAASFFMTLLGGWLSDRVMGRYRTILYLSIGYVIGHATLAVADAAPDLRIDLLYLGMALIAVGAGGVKPNVSAFVCDQFGRAQRSLLDRVYSWFYFGINVGSASSQVATPWLLAGCGGLCVTTAVAVAFGVPGVLMALALLFFLVGRREYVRVPPVGRTGKAFLDMLRARMSGAEALRRRFGEEGEVAVRSVFKITLVFLPIVAFWALYFQYGSSWFDQAKRMNLDVFGWHMEPAQMEALNAILILVMVPFFAYVVYPRAERLGLRPTLLRRIVAGMFIAAPAFLFAAMIQRWIEAGQTPSIGWQVIQYVIISIAETLISVTALEFAYTQAPKSMKSTIMSLWFFTLAAGSWLTGVVTRNVHFETRSGYFIFWALFMLGGAILEAVVALFYKPVPFVAVTEAEAEPA
ncbi:MAG: POT family MFS transporter [Deltaproteobacteria bacterium]|nr:MAG: POT family MFS transporter [Deltaproteobacteria bacterium]